MRNFSAFVFIDKDFILDMHSSPPEINSIFSIVVIFNIFGWISNFAFRVKWPYEGRIRFLWIISNGELKRIARSNWWRVTEC